MVGRSDAAHFVPPHVSRDVLIERRQLAIAPVLVQDVELQHLTLDLKVIECRHGVGIVASPAHHSAQFVPDAANNEILLGRTHAKAQPDSGNIFLSELRFPRTRLNVARKRSAHSLLVDCHSRNRRRLRQPGHDDRQRIGPSGVFNEDALELAGAGLSRSARHDQIAVIESRCLLVLIRRASIRIHVRHYETDAVRPELAVHKSQRRRIGAIGAIDSPNRIAPDRELIRYAPRPGPFSIRRDSRRHPRQRPRGPIPTRPEAKQTALF